jgi:hypothetical protein
MAKGLGILLSFVLLAVTLLLVYQYSMTSLASTDTGVNLTGTQYEGAYAASVDTSVAAVGISKYIVLLVGGFAVLVALAVFVGIMIKKR